jgi:hypothetical protein
MKMEDGMPRVMFAGVILALALAGCGQPDDPAASQSAPEPTSAPAAPAVQETTMPTETPLPAPEAEQPMGAPQKQPQTAPTPAVTAAASPAVLATPRASLPGAQPASQQAQPPLVAPGDAPTPGGSFPALVPTAEPPQVNPTPPDLLARLTDDAAARSGTERGAISVVLSEAVLWNDGALGCPRPGAVYTQAPVEGYRVVLRAGGHDYDYRVGERGRFILCEPGGTP